MILLTGIAVLSFKLVITESWARFLEACVGIMLIGLGLFVGMSLVREHLHGHSHNHDGEDASHFYLHAHHDGHAVCRDPRSLRAGTRPIQHLSKALAPKAVDRLGYEWERLVTFYQFPREHWCHLRTTNVVESPFAAVRLRTTAAERYKRVESATALIRKLLQVAEQTFRRLNAPELLPAVYAGAQYVDGVQNHRAARQEVWHRYVYLRTSPKVVCVLSCKQGKSQLRPCLGDVGSMGMRIPYAVWVRHYVQ